MSARPDRTSAAPPPTTARAWVDRGLGHGRRLEQGVRRLTRRYLPAESQHLMALTILVGVACGAAAVAFHLAIREAERLLIDRAIAAPGLSWIGWTVLTPTLGGLLAGIALHTIVPGARGSGVPQVKAAFAFQGGRIRLRDALGKFVLASMQIGSGASLGREGPTVHICAGVANLLARVTGLPPRNARRLMPVGVAAGIAAAFNAPIAAVTFTIEEVVGTLDHSVLSGVVVAAAIAAVIERAVLGGHPIITVGAEYGLHDPWSLVFYVLLGVVAAVAGVAFTDGLLKLRGAWKHTRAVPVWAQPAVGGLATGILLVVALGALHVGGINGGGYETLGLALDGNLGLKVLLALFALKALATIASYSSGGVGGIFAPTLFMGAMLGGAVGYLDVAVFDHGTDQLGAFALVGMGALFAGVIRAPITAVLIIFEMTGSYGLVLPLMVASTVAYAIARRWRPTSIYEALLNQDGVFLPARGRRPHPLENLQVADAMTAEVVAASAQTTVAEAARMFDAGGFALLPVVDDRRWVIAAVHARQVRGAVAAGALRTPLLELAQPVQTIHADALLLDAVVRMTRLGVRQLVVTDGNAHERLVGILSMTDLVRAHARTARAEDTAQHAAVADDDATEDGAPPRSSPHDLRAGGIMVAAPVVPVDAALHALIDHALASSCHVVVVAHADRAPGLITLDRLRPFLRDEDLQKMLRAADLERPAPCLVAGAPLMEVVRALVDGDAPAVVVVDDDGRTPRGVVTREEVSAVLLDWYARGNGGASDRPSNGPADAGRGGDIA